ncbi:MAG: FtsX-like permease family protein, partial [Candidatus Aureabacteria bacterium]|nr:FtsX-like permease family protein [Candidatus Auribacterota bacterium]
MQLILKIAWRNIWRHKGKSLVIGTILFLGALLMTIGNGIIAGMEKGLQDNIINGFLGDVVIVSDKQKSDNILFEFYGKAVEPIHNYPDIKKVLDGETFVEKFLPAGKNMAMGLNEEGDPTWVYLLGVDFTQYEKMFPDNLTLIEGRLFKPKEKGILVPVFARNEYYNFTNLWLLPEGGTIIEENLSREAKENKTDLKTSSNGVFLGYNNENSTTDVRVGIKGIIKYRALNTFWGHFMIMDIESYRECMGYFAASEIMEVLPENKKKLLNLDNDDLDSSFEDEKMFTENMTAAHETETPVITKSVVEKPLNLESGTYNLVLLKLNKNVPLDEAVKRLNRLLEENNLHARAITWKKASGMIGSLSVLIKGFLFGFVMFLFLVAIMIIVNTLTMAALERTSEIGMMRAVGAQKNFIRLMFMGETGILSAFFGGFGIIIGILLVAVLPVFQITTQNDMLQLLYGGDTLRPFLNTWDILITIIQLISVSLLA